MAAKCLSTLFLLWLKQNRQPIYTTQQAQHSSLAIGSVGLSELSWALAGMSWGELRWAKVKWSYLSIRAAPPVSLSSLCLHVLLSNTKNTSRDSHFECRFVLAYSFAACILYFHHQRQSINHHHSPFINVHGYPTDPTIRFVAFLFVCCCRFTYR